MICRLCQSSFYARVLLNTVIFHTSCTSHLLQIFVLKPHGLQPVQPRAPRSRTAFPAELPPGAPLPPLRSLLEIFPASLLRFFLRSRPYLDLVGDGRPRSENERRKKQENRKNFRRLQDMSTGILLYSRSEWYLIIVKTKPELKNSPQGAILGRHGMHTCVS